MITCLWCSESLIGRQRMYCSRNCQNKGWTREMKRDADAGLTHLGTVPVHSRTMGEMRTLGGKGRNLVQRHASQTLDNYNYKRTCALCSYTKATDICHVKDIAKFPNDTTVLEVNALSNLVVLCKNHHWEFDHDML